MVQCDGSFKYPKHMIWLSNKNYGGYFVWLQTLNSVLVLINGAFLYHISRGLGTWTMPATACSLFFVVKLTSQCKTLKILYEVKSLLIYLLSCCLYCLSSSSCIYYNWCILIGFIVCWTFEINLLIYFYRNVLSKRHGTQTDTTK